MSHDKVFHCAYCRTKMGYGPGIGHFCENPECKSVDGPAFEEAGYLGSDRPDGVGPDSQVRAAMVVPCVAVPTPAPPDPSPEVVALVNAYRKSIIMAQITPGNSTFADEFAAKAALLAEFTRLRDQLESWNRIWGEVIDFAQANGETLGMRLGRSIADWVLETMKEKVQAAATPSETLTAPVEGIQADLDWMDSIAAVHGEPTRASWARIKASIQPTPTEAPGTATPPARPDDKGHTPKPYRDRTACADCGLILPAKAECKGKAKIVLHAEPMPDSGEGGT